MKPQDASLFDAIPIAGFFLLVTVWIFSAPASGAAVVEPGTNGLSPLTSFGLSALMSDTTETPDSQYGYSRRLGRRPGIWGRRSKIENSHSSEMSFWFRGRPFQAKSYGGRLYDLRHKMKMSTELIYNQYSIWQGDKTGDIGWLATVSYRKANLFGSRASQSQQMYRLELGPCIMLGQIYLWDEINGVYYKKDNQHPKYSGMGISTLLELRPTRWFIFRTYAAIAGARRKTQEQSLGSGYGDHTSFAEFMTDIGYINWVRGGRFGYELSLGYHATFDVLRRETILDGLAVAIRLQW